MAGATPTNNYLGAFNFRVRLDGINDPLDGFLKISPIVSKTEEMTFKHGWDRAIRKSLGQTTFEKLSKTVLNSVFDRSLNPVRYAETCRRCTALRVSHQVSAKQESAFGRRGRVGYSNRHDYACCRTSRSICIGINLGRTTMNLAQRERSILTRISSSRRPRRICSTEICLGMGRSDILSRTWSGYHRNLIGTTNKSLLLPYTISRLRNRPTITLTNIADFHARLLRLWKVRPPATHIVERPYPGRSQTIRSAEHPKLTRPHGPTFWRIAMLSVLLFTFGTEAMTARHTPEQQVVIQGTSETLHQSDASTSQMNVETMSSLDLEGRFAPSDASGSIQADLGRHTREHGELLYVLMESPIC